MWVGRAWGIRPVRSAVCCKGRVRDEAGVANIGHQSPTRDALQHERAGGGAANAHEVRLIWSPRALLEL